MLPIGGRYYQAMRVGEQSRLGIAGAVFVVLWLPALVLSCFLSLMGYISTGFTPLPSALILLMALPALLIGVWSFRISSVVLIALFLGDLFTSAWPHVSVVSYLSANVGLMMLSLAMLGLLIWAASPFVSIAAFCRQVRDQY